MNVGETFDVDIADVAYRGAGIARKDGIVIFVPGALEGEKVKIRISASKKRFFEAEIIEIIKPSSSRIEPCCRLPDGTRVPGCVYDHVSYPAEVALKDSQLRNFLRKFVTDSDSVFLPALASPLPLHYRNKVVFHVQKQDDGLANIGYLGDDNRTVADIESCPLADDAINFAWARMRDGARKRLKDGDSITFRHTKDNGVVSWVNKAPENSEWITEETLAGDVQVPPEGFFQVNPGVASALVSQVRDWIAEAMTKDAADTLLDLYCGVGIFGLVAAKNGVQNVIGVESGRNAVTAARRNARSLSVPNAKFFCETTAESVKRAFHVKDFAHTVAVVDPPRSGMEPAASNALAESGIRTIVYVSCDPSTLSRDLAVFAEHGYSVCHARMFDMFPRTMHFESAVLLSY